MFLDVTWLHSPKVFISSTMDDPSRQYRSLIIKALDRMGLNSVEFQDATFPYSLEERTDIINETIQGVRAADVFLLIIGKRYGYVVDSKSVVHLEYEEAIAASMPIFCFIDERVWNDFRREQTSTEFIENEEHFKFIKTVSKYKVIPFRDIDECINHIKAQLNNFMGGCFKFSKQATWLWNEYHTRSKEKQASEVWIITPDFYWDFDDREFRNIVSKNIIERDCVYRYIYKSTSDNNNRIEEMKRVYEMLFKDKGKDPSVLSKLIMFLGVPNEEFYWASEQIIFNPFELDERAIMVDIMDVRDKTLKFNIEFGRYWNGHCNEEDKIII